MRKSAVFYLALLLLLSGCATWVKVGGPHENSTHNFKVELPDGWRQYNFEKSQLLITKDGLSLQYIAIARKPIDEELAFTQKTLLKEMLPQEAAEITIDNLRSNPNILNLQVIENMPVLMGGQPGFKIIYQFQTKGGLTKKGVHFCCLVEEWRYTITYLAPARYYFEKELPALDTVQQTFALLDSP